MKRSIVLLALCLAPATVHAQTAVRHYASGEYSTGGDELVDPTSGDGLDAGGAWQVTYGARFTSEELPDWEVDARFGWRFALEDVTGGDASFTRWAVELLVQRRLGGRLRVGLGPVLHLAPRYRLETGTVDDRIDFEDAFGYSAHIDFQVGTNIVIGGRYLDIDYEKDDASFILPNGDVVKKIDGSATGLYVSYLF